MKRIISKARLMGVLAAALALAAVVVSPAPSEVAEAASAPIARPSFAADTDPEYAAQVTEELRNGPNAQHRFGTHWNPLATALNNGGGGQGDSLELTWSIIPDGTFMPSQGSFDTSCNSNLIATFDAVYGAGNWQAEIQDVWDDWNETTANVYTPAVALDANGTPVDDGAAWPITSGVAGVRGDIRIGGCTIDGNSGVLAYNFFPSNGDMKLDAVDSFYAFTSIDPGFHNVFSHEHGHGIGLSHVCPVDSSKLMEPFINTSFRGLQHDDVRGVQRGYGDRFELIDNENDVQGNATPISPIGGTSETFLSIDSVTDRDWFEFSGNAGDTVDVTVTPNGFTYLEGNDPVSDGCSSSSPVPLDSTALQNLRFDIRDSAGTLVDVDANPVGGTESISGFALPADGTYFVRVQGGGVNDAQLYDLDVTQTPGVGGGPVVIGNRVWDDLDGNGIQNSGEPGVAGATVNVRDASGAIDTTKTTNAGGFWTATVDSGAAWTIEVVAPAGRSFTTQNAGVNDNRDSDADPATGEIDIPAGTLSAGSTDKSFDAGLAPTGGGPAIVGNRVWFDSNDNGIQNPGEVGVSGVTIEILTSSGMVDQTTTTNTGGFWTLSVDPSQAWKIRVTPPAGTTFTLRNQGTNDNRDSDVFLSNGVVVIPAGTLSPGDVNKSFDAGIAEVGA